MTLLILCCWSCILIFLALVCGKYRWTTPPWALIVCFALGALPAAMGAATLNGFISRETELWFFSDDRVKAALGFTLGAGFGEEFWKFGAGLLVLGLGHALGWPLRPPGVVLAFVTLGLSFAALENLVAYAHLDGWVLANRGVTAVVLHASMGLVHGLAAVLAWRWRRTWPLLLGYAVTVTLHAGYDVIHLFAPEWLAGVLLYGMVLSLVLLTVVTWWLLLEQGPNLAEAPLPDTPSGEDAAWTPPVTHRPPPPAASTGR